MRIYSSGILWTHANYHSMSFFKIFYAAVLLYLYLNIHANTKVQYAIVHRYILCRFKMKTKINYAKLHAMHMSIFLCSIHLPIFAYHMYTDWPTKFTCIRIVLRFFVFVTFCFICWIRSDDRVLFMHGLDQHHICDVSKTNVTVHQQYKCPVWYRYFAPISNSSHLTLGFILMHIKKTNER